MGPQSPLCERTLADVSAERKTPDGPALLFSQRKPQDRDDRGADNTENRHQARKAERQQPQIEDPEQSAGAERSADRHGSYSKLEDPQRTRTLPRADQHGPYVNLDFTFTLYETRSKGRVGLLFF